MNKNKWMNRGCQAYNVMSPIALFENKRNEIKRKSMLFKIVEFTIIMEFDVEYHLKNQFIS